MKLNKGISGEMWSVPSALGVFPISRGFVLAIRDKRTGKTKGYGFVSFASPSDLAAALKEMNGKFYIVHRANMFLAQHIYLIMLCWAIYNRVGAYIVK